MAQNIIKDFSQDNASHQNSTITVSSEGSEVNLPDASFVRDADLSRDGMDLVMHGPQGTVVVQDYFAADPAPDLIAPDGARLTSNLVDSFTQSGNQYANAGSMTDESPVGNVTEFSGNATVKHVDGSVETVTIGTRIYQGDVVETGGDGAVNIVFVDETEFAVSEDARLAIDEYVYDPSTQAGTQNFSVLKGVFVFTSGMIGRDDPDDVQIETPVGSIGIRGTIIAGDVSHGEITVVEGAIVLTDFSGNQVTLSNQFETARFSTTGHGVENIGQLSANDVASKFASVSNVAPNLFSSIGDAAAEGQGRSAQGGESANEAKGEADAQDSKAGSDGEAQGDTAATDGKAAAQGEANGDSSKGTDAKGAEGKGTDAPADGANKAAPAGEGSPGNEAKANVPATEASKAATAGETAQGPAAGPAINTTNTQASKGGLASLAGDHGPATNTTIAPRAPVAPANPTTSGTLTKGTIAGSTLGNEPLRDPTISNTTNNTSTDTTSTVVTPNATFLTHSYNEIVDGVTPPSQTVLAQIKVAAGSNVGVSDFTFSNIPSALLTGGKIHVEQSTSDPTVFKVIVDNTTQIRNGLDFDHVTQLLQDSSNAKVTVRGETLDLGHQILTNIHDVNEGPTFAKSASASNGYDTQVYEGHTSDFVDSVSLEHFRASDATKWTFDFRQLFTDPDFGRDSGTDVLASGAQGNIAEQLTYQLSANTLSALNTHLGNEIYAVRDSNGTAINLSTGLFNGSLYIEFTSTTASDFDFNIEIQAIDSNNNASGYQSFKFEYLDSHVFLGTDVNQNFTTGNQVIAVNPGVGISSGSFSINSDGNEVFFGLNNDNGITIESNKTGNTLHLGKGDDSTLIDTNAYNNIIIGDEGNDTITIRGADNNIYGGQGNDRFILDVASNGNLLANVTYGLAHSGTDSLYDGGADTLALPPQGTSGTATAGGDVLKFQTANSETVNFSLFSSKIHNIETLDFDNTFSDTVALRRQDVINMTDGRNTLIVDLEGGSGADQLNFDAQGATFTQGSDVTVDSTTYHSYSDGTVTLLINTDAANSTNVSGLPA